MYGLLRKAQPEELPCDIPGVSIETIRNDHFMLVTARLENAIALDRDGLAEQVHSAYQVVAKLLGSSPTKHPVRFWNHIPNIRADMGAGLDRYMAFNVGRHKAFSEWYGAANLSHAVATGTGVGCRGSDVVIHVLACDHGGVNVANPRQKQPAEYSARSGPCPPCFSRATVLARQERRRFVFLGGTASIVGEETTHVGDLPGQLDETFDNLRLLLQRCGEVPLGSNNAPAARKGSLASIKELRVYLVDSRTTSTIEQAIAEVMPGARKIEMIQTELCRPDLLVEVEGIAEL